MNDSTDFMLEKYSGREIVKAEVSALKALEQRFNTSISPGENLNAGEEMFKHKGNHVTGLVISRAEDLDEIPGEIFCFPNLETLIITMKVLSKIPGKIGELKRLKKLNLTAYGYPQEESTPCPEELSQLTELEELTLQLRLTDLPESIGNLFHLRDLKLDFNRIKALPASIGKLHDLEILEISNNNLASLPDSIRDLTKLNRFILACNQLTMLPATFGGLVSLDTISLDDNKLTKLPSTIGQLKKLQRLSVQNNALIELPDAIGDCEGLCILDISRNKIKGLPSSIRKLQRLGMLMMDKNLIHDVVSLLINIFGPLVLGPLSAGKGVPTRTSIKLDKGNYAFIPKDPSDPRATMISRPLEDEEAKLFRRYAASTGIPLNQKPDK